MMMTVSDLQSPSNTMAMTEDGTRTVRAYSTISVRVSTGMRSAIEECAIQRGISSSELARLAMEKELGIRNGFWIDLPDAIMSRLSSDVESGRFLNIGEAIRYYLVRCLGMDDLEVFV